MLDTAESNSGAILVVKGKVFLENKKDNLHSLAPCAPLSLSRGGEVTRGGEGEGGGERGGGRGREGGRGTCLSTVRYFKSFPPIL